MWTGCARQWRGTLLEACGSSGGAAAAAAASPRLQAAQGSISMLGLSVAAGAWPEFVKVQKGAGELNAIKFHIHVDRQR